MPSHRPLRLQWLDVIAFGLWDDLEESRNKEAKIRNTKEMYIIASFEYVAQPGLLQCHPMSTPVSRCSNKVSLMIRATIGGPPSQPA